MTDTDFSNSATRTLSGRLRSSAPIERSILYAGKQTEKFHAERRQMAGEAAYLDWTSTRIATATIATAMNIQYWIRTPKMQEHAWPSPHSLGRDFHSMLIASKPSHLHPPTTFAAKLRWLSRCAVFTFSMANILRRVVRALALASLV